MKAWLIGLLAAVGVGGVAVAAEAAKKGTIAGARGNVPIPSTPELVQKYGLNNPHDNILTFASDSFDSMRVQYSKYTNCPEYLQGQGGPGAGYSIAGEASQAVSAIPVVGGLISEVTQFFTNIFAHHAQAVQNERTDLCGVSLSWNMSMDDFDRTIANGNLTAAQAEEALTALYNSAAQTASRVAQGCPPPTARGTAAAMGNEACVVLRIIQGISEKRLAQLGVVGEIPL